MPVQWSQGVLRSSNAGLVYGRECSEKGELWRVPKSALCGCSHKCKQFRSYLNHLVFDTERTAAFPGGRGEIFRTCSDRVFPGGKAAGAWR